MELRDVIRLAREQRGYSQVELGERTGISYRTISDIERGIIKFPRQDTLSRLADALGVSLADLVIAAGLANTKTQARRVAASLPKAPFAEESVLREELHAITSDFYGHLAEGVHREAADRLDELLGFNEVH